MAGNGSSSSLPFLPVFKGNGYSFWSLKMKTMFKSQELWEIVHAGFQDDGTVQPDQALKELRKKDSKALFLIQQALDDEIFPRILSAETSHAAWIRLKQEYMGDSKVVVVKLQTLR